jgi:hypothetical protein
MKSITRHTGTLKLIGRMKNSKNGNPQFMLSCDGYQFRTEANSSIAYQIEKYIDKFVSVTIGIHRNCATLHSVKLIPNVQLTEEQKINMYLDWFNNFISLQGFADHYRIKPEYADQIIKQGRQAHERRVFADIV